MRFSATVLLVAMASGAQASSVLVLEPASGRYCPSMVAAGTPPATRSMIALGEATVSDEKLSAIPADPTPAKWLRQDALHVIRGGISGHEFPRKISARQAQPHGSPLTAPQEH